MLEPFFDRAWSAGLGDLCAIIANLSGDPRSQTLAARAEIAIATGRVDLLYC